MKFLEEEMSLRIFIGETDRYKGKALYEQIVLKAKELKLSGVTVVRGLMGFGADSRMHTAKLLSLSDNSSIIIEIVDFQENLDRLLPFLDDAVQEGMVTLEKVKVTKYRHG
jgi:PII-like signaling protein